MSRLQIIDARKMEKLLFKLGFERVHQKGTMCSTGILMEEPQVFRIIEEEIWHAH